jgi:outer membrane protein TolC
MWQHFIKKANLLLGFGLLVPGISFAQSLSVNEATELALRQDLATRQLHQKAEALRQQAIAADTLPDPRVKLGLMNYPTDTFERSQEAMTQNVIGIQQMFPAGDSLKIKSARTLAMASMTKSAAENSRRKLVCEVRKAWLETYYWRQAIAIVKQNEALFSELVNITSAQYAAGRHKQQDVIRAELELGMLQDRITKVETMTEVNQSALVRLIGESHAQRKLTRELPEFPPAAKDKNWLETHPLIEKENARLLAGEKNVSLAKQAYKPSWMLDVTYGKREGLNIDGSERADFLSAMVMFDLPLFTANRQDKKVAASRLRLNSAQDMREDKKRQLKEMWDKSYARWQKLNKRSEHYQNNLLPKSNENARSSLFDYQNGRGNFNSLVRSQIMALETQLRALRINVDKLQMKAQLLYLAGEEK